VAGEPVQRGDLFGVGAVPAGRTLELGEALVVVERHRVFALADRAGCPLVKPFGVQTDPSSRRWCQSTVAGWVVDVARGSGSPQRRLRLLEQLPRMAQ